MVKQFSTAILALVLLACQGKTIDRTTIKYSDGFYDVNNSKKVAVYIDPGDSRIVDHLEENRIVKITATVSLKKPNPVWYFVEESDIKGYVLDHDLELFYTKKEA